MPLPCPAGLVGCTSPRSIYTTLFIHSNCFPLTQIQFIPLFHRLVVAIRTPPTSSLSIHFSLGLWGCLGNYALLDVGGMQSSAVIYAHTSGCRIGRRETYILGEDKGTDRDVNSISCFPICAGQRPMDNWIVGHSLVFGAQHCAALGPGTQLGFDHLLLIQWLGCQEILCDQLMLSLSKALNIRCQPDVLMLQLKSYLFCCPVCCLT